MKFSLLVTTKMLTNSGAIFVALKLSAAVFILLLNVKMPKIVGILTCINRIKFMLGLVEHEKVLYPLALVLRS